MQINDFNIFKTVFAVCLTWASTMLGGWDLPLQLLGYAIAMDILTGLWVAVQTKTVSSTASFQGMTKKVFIVILVAFGNLLDQAVGTTYVHEAVVWFFFINEGISILENAAKVGLPIPKVLTDTLDKVKGQMENVSK